MYDCSDQPKLAFIAKELRASIMDAAVRGEHETTIDAIVTHESGRPILIAGLMPILSQALTSGTTLTPGQAFTEVMWTLGDAISHLPVHSMGMSIYNPGSGLAYVIAESRGGAYIAKRMQITRSTIACTIDREVSMQRPSEVIERGMFFPSTPFAIRAIKQSAVIGQIRSQIKETLQQHAGR